MDGRELSRYACNVSLLLRPMRSAYATTQGSEPEFTNWSQSLFGDLFKGEKTIIHMIIHVQFSGFTMLCSFIE